MNFDENWNSLKFTSTTDENIMSAGGTAVNPSFSFGPLSYVCDSYICYDPSYCIYADSFQQICNIVMFGMRNSYGCGEFAFSHHIFYILT